MGIAQKEESSSPTLPESLSFAAGCQNMLPKGLRLRLFELDDELCFDQSPIVPFIVHPQMSRLA